MTALTTTTTMTQLSLALEVGRLPPHHRQAGRPQAWRKGKRVYPDLDAEEGVWASGRNSIDARGHDEEGIAYPGPCAINCTNSRGVYSFHKGFANVCFADGSVRGLREGLDVWVYYSLLTIRGGDILSPKDYEAD